MIQSMLSCDTMDKKKVFEQIDALTSAGCDIIRLAVETDTAAKICQEYLDYAKVPLVADIQFDYKLAILCSDLGFAKVRFNPGNVGGQENVREIVRACKANGTAIRVGVNSGSLEKKLLKEYGGRTANALAQSVLDSLKILENEGFFDTVISVKSSNIKTLVESNRIIASRCDYPLHIGLTESGWGRAAEIKSAIGIGTLLLDGIGDTIRVSLTGEPVQEVIAAKRILKALGLIGGCDIISCPTCSRCKNDLESVVKEVENFVKDLDKNLKIAVMGCAVNGPGEASDADVGVAFGVNNAVIFKKGKVIKVVSSDKVLEELKQIILNL